MYSTGVPSRASTASPDSASGNTSRRSSWGRSRRTFMACTECRRRQVKCTPSDSAGQACERCVKRKIKCEFISIQEQKLLSTPDSDQSSASVTLHFPQYGGPVGGVTCQMSAGPILGDPADVRQGMLCIPATRPPIHTTGMSTPATASPLRHHQILNSSTQTHHRPGSPSWKSQHYPQPALTPVPRYATPTSLTPVPQSTASTPTWNLVGNSQSPPPGPGYYSSTHAHTQVRRTPDVQWRDPRGNTQP